MRRRSGRGAHLGCTCAPRPQTGLSSITLANHVCSAVHQAPADLRGMRACEHALVPMLHKVVLFPGLLQPEQCQVSTFRLPSEGDTGALLQEWVAALCRSCSQVTLWRCPAGRARLLLDEQLAAAGGGRQQPPAALKAAQHARRRQAEGHAPGRAVLRQGTRSRAQSATRQRTESPQRAL